MMPPTLHDLTPHELQMLLVEMGEPGYRGRQLAEGLYGRQATSLEEITTLPAALRRVLQESHGLTQLLETGRQPASDGTVKHLFELKDGRRIEAVSIAMEKGKRTFCLSSQVGCAMACTFCATARMGLIRQLTAGEIVAQVLKLRRLHPTHRQVNLVFMGMGEPLDNLENLTQALAILSDPEGLNIGARHITISTSGLAAGIEGLARLQRPYGLAVSLSSARPRTRRQLMPVAGASSLPDLIAAAAAYGENTHRTVTLEYVLIAGVNDGDDDGDALIELASKGPFKVNLIPLNPVEGYSGKRPSTRQIARFADRLWQARVICTVRDSAGREIAAACGQLALKKRKPAKKQGTGTGRATSGESSTRS